MGQSRTELEALARRIAQRTVALDCRGFNWGEGVAWHAVAQAGRALGEEGLVAAAGDWVREHERVEPSTMLEAAPGLAVLEVAEATGDGGAQALVDRIVDYLLRYPRSRLGAYCDAADTQAGTLVAADYWYLSAPLLMRVARRRGDDRCADLAGQLAIGYAHSCWSSADCLFAHTYDDANATRAPWHWGRASGWATLALVETLELLPGHGGVKLALARHLERTARRLRELQDPSGAWHTVVDRCETDLETSATAMIALALRRAVDGGHLGGGYGEVADRGFAAVAAAVDDDGAVTGVSGWTPPGGLADYSSVALGVFPWGQGMALAACLQWLRTAA